MAARPHHHNLAPPPSSSLSPHKPSYISPSQRQGIFLTYITYALSFAFLSLRLLFDSSTTVLTSTWATALPLTLEFYDGAGLRPTLPLHLLVLHE